MLGTQRNVAQKVKNFTIKEWLNRKKKVFWVSKCSFLSLKFIEGIPKMLLVKEICVESASRVTARVSAAALFQHCAVLKNKKRKDV